MDRIKDLKLKSGTVVPKLRDDYPEEDPYVRLYQPEYIRDLCFDEHYPYVDDSRRGRFLRIFGNYCVLRTVVWAQLRFQMGLHVEGRHWLKKYKHQLTQGAITIANHCHRHDAESIMLAVDSHLPHLRIPMFAANFNTKDKTFLEMVGGVPIPPPEMGMAAMKQFNASFDEFHRRGYWFHIFPESCKWDWYKPLRPFQKGAFSMAYKYAKPIVPCIITWRPRTGIYKLFGPKDMPLMTVRICEPIFPDTHAPRKIEVDRLREKAHLCMQEAADILYNTWPIAPQNE